MIENSRLVRKLADEGVDVLVASTPQNVFYLSGLRSLSQELLGEHAFVVRAVGNDVPIIVLPSVDASIVIDRELAYERVFTYGSFHLYGDTGLSSADEEVLSLLEQEPYGDGVEALLAALKPYADTATTFAIERDGLSPGEFEQISEGLSIDDPRPGGPICAELRRSKSDEEVRRLKRSVEINERAIEASVEGAKVGMTERELASRYHEHLVAEGAEPLFTVIGFGAHGAYPHAVSGERSLQVGDLIRFDVGCEFENYASDIARTFAFRETDDRTRRRYEVLSSGMDRTIELLKDGTTTDAVFRGTLDHIRTIGSDVFDGFDRNHFGHGIGIDVYDPPTIDREPNPITSGMVMCVEPPFYELGSGGIQVEDEVHVTENGVERLSRCSPTLSVLD